MPTDELDVLDARFGAHSFKHAVEGVVLSPGLLGLLGADNFQHLLRHRLRPQSERLLQSYMQRELREGVKPNPDEHRDILRILRVEGEKAPRRE